MSNVKNSAQPNILKMPFFDVYPYFSKLVASASSSSNWDKNELFSFWA